MRFLMFTVYAPMGSFGETAVGERRMSWPRPGRSAVFGLVAAALGIERTDEAAHKSIETGLYYASKTYASGKPFVDFHTAQAPKARRGQTYSTRREELRATDLNTVLSRREWRADIYFRVSLWPRREDAIDLEVITKALRYPEFSLYIGRKSAPFGLPLNPVIVEASTFMEAFENHKPSEEEEAVLKRISSKRTSSTTHATIAFDEDAPGAPFDFRVERRRDAVVSRTHWQFMDRSEHVVLLKDSEE